MTSEKDMRDSSGRGVDNGGFIRDIAKREEQPAASFKDRYHHEYLSAKESQARNSEKSAFSTTDKDEDEVDLSCGIWKFRTNALGKRFANLYVFTIVVGISMFFTGMVQSVIHVQLTSIERQFKIDNARAGLFDTASKAGHLTTILLASHFAKKVHIPLVISLAGMFQGTILMVPAFMQIANPYTLPLLTGDGNDSHSAHGDNLKYFCRNNNTPYNDTTVHKIKTKEPSDEYNQIAFIVILIIQGIKGVTDAFHSGFLPTLYVDDNVLDKSKLGIFFGIKYIMGELSSPISKQLNAYLTTVPTDLKKTEMDPKDQRFVAAWWLCFLLFGGATVFFSFPILLFPRQLVSKRQQQAALQRALVSFTPDDDDGKTITDKGKVNDTLRKPSIVVIGVKDDISTSGRGKRTFTPRSSVNRGSFYSNASSRKSSLFPPVNGPSERKVSIDGSMAFDQPIKIKPHPVGAKSMQTSTKEILKDFPKAVVRVFKRPVFLLMLADIAIVSIPSSGISVFRSIYTATEYNVTMTDVATLTGVTSMVSHLIGTLSSGWLASRVKTKVGYMWIIFITYIITNCITPFYIILGCDNQPIYGHDGRYGIPVNMTETCGCGPVKQLLSCGSDGRNYLTPCHAGCESSIGKTFINCTGIADAAMTLVPGLCDTPCRKRFYLYIALHAIQGMIGGMASIPRRLLILRIVDPRDRAFATGLFAFFGTILSLPAPNLFGRVIDDACLVKDGAVCTLYDRDRIRYIISGVDVGTSLVVQVTFVLMLLVFKYEERQMKRKAAEEDIPPGPDDPKK